MNYYYMMCSNQFNIGDVRPLCATILSGWGLLRESQLW